jgi:hypothetical protein
MALKTRIIHLGIAVPNRNLGFRALQSQSEDSEGEEKACR